MITHPPPSAAHLLEALLAATDQIEFKGEREAGVTSSRQAFKIALSLLLERERGGSALATERLRAVTEWLTRQPWPHARAAGQAAGERISAQARSIDVATAEAEAARALLISEAGLAESETVLDASAIRELCEWEFERLAANSSSTLADAGALDTEIDASRLQAYLHDRFDDTSIRIIECRPLMGGFGKQTYVFTAQGAKLEGEFVIRRDHPVELVPGACHRVAREFEVIKALREEGFPAPDALWLDCEHRLLPGGDFIVMRRSPGAPGGTLQGARSRPDPALNDQLGALMGRLHSLPPLIRLGELTESIRPELWTASAGEVLRNYLREFRSMLLSRPHAPSIATVAVLNWLIENVPESDARPCLIHGDIGFHNILLENGEMTALLDWENAQIGHPGQDLAYVYNAGHAALDWPRVMRAYQSAGGVPLNDRELLYFRIMMLARLAVTLNVGPAHLFSGHVRSLRLLNAETLFRPPVLKQLAELIERYSAEYGGG